MTRRRDAPTTAKELLSRLESDPAWVAGRDEQERILQARSTELRAAEEPLIRDLRRVGVDVASAWDLVNTAEPYPEAIPVLVDHLQRSYPDSVGDGIARALAAREAVAYARQIVAAYEATSSSDMPRKKDGLACAVAATCPLIDVIRLIQEPSHGDSRLFFLRPLKRSKDPRASLLLNELEADPVFEKEIASWRRDKGRATRTNVEPTQEP